MQFMAEFILSSVHLSASKEEPATARQLRYIKLQGWVNCHFQAKLGNQKLAKLL